MGDDVFASPKPKPSNAIKYPTSNDFLEATRNSEIPDQIEKSDFMENQKIIGSSVMNILLNEYKAPMPVNVHSDANYYCKMYSANVFVLITGYELSGRTNELLQRQLQNEHEAFSQYVGNDEFMKAFDRLANAYAIAVRTSVTLKQEAAAKNINDEADKRRQADLAEQQRLMDQLKANQQKEIEQKQMAEAEHAKAESKLEEDRLRTEAVKAAMDAEIAAREQKRKEIMASPAYKLWISALQIEEGLKMVREAKQILERQAAIEHESNVADLTARRSAGERIVAGKQLVKSSFASYKELGGTALTPEEVHAGPNPVDAIYHTGYEDKQAGEGARSSQPPRVSAIETRLDFLTPLAAAKSIFTAIQTGDETAINNAFIGTKEQKETAIQNFRYYMSSATLEAAATATFGRDATLTAFGPGIFERAAAIPAALAALNDCDVTIDGANAVITVKTNLAGAALVFLTPALKLQQTGDQWKVLLDKEMFDPEKMGSGAAFMAKANQKCALSIKAGYFPNAVEADNWYTYFYTGGVLTSPPRYGPPIDLKRLFDEHWSLGW